MKKVFVVDDTREIRELIEIILRGEGYEVHCYPSGKHLISAVLELNPDLIILDIMLGEYDGHELCDELKDDTRTSHIPIMMISASNNLQSRLCMAEDYLAKPFQIDNMVEKVAALVTN